MLDDHPNGDAIRLLYGAGEEDPAVAIVLDDGPHLHVNTGHTDDAVQAQLDMIGTYIDWLAGRTDVPPETVAEDAVAVARRLRSDEFDTTEIRGGDEDGDEIQ